MSNNEDIRDGWKCPNCKTIVSPYQVICPECSTRKVDEGKDSEDELLLG
jgi:uncharacterized OB-fold protein